MPGAAPSRLFVTVAVLASGVLLALVLRISFGTQWWLALLPLWGPYALFVLVAVVLAAVEFSKVRRAARDARRHRR